MASFVLTEDYEEFRNHLRTEGQLISSQKLSPFTDSRIGSGSYKSVYRTYLDFKVVALALPKPVSGKDEVSKSRQRRHLKNFLDEIGLHASLGSNFYIAQFLGLVEIPKGPGFTPGIVTAFYQNGSLHDFLKSNTPVLKLRQIYTLAEDILRGLMFLHSLNPPVWHNDLKPGNILLDADLRGKISDFGMCIRPTESWLLSNQYLAGTFEYRAPEFWPLEYEIRPSVTYFNEKIDVYAFGITLWNLFMDRHRRVNPNWRWGPALQTHESILYFKGSVCQGLRPPLDKIVSEYPSHAHRLVVLFDFLWTNVPNQRATTLEALDAILALQHALPQRFNSKEKDCLSALWTLSHT